MLELLYNSRVSAVILNIDFYFSENPRLPSLLDAAKILLEYYIITRYY